MSLARAAAGEEFSLATAVGGPRGVAEAVAPGLAFVAVFTFSRDLRLALTVALAAAGVAVLARLVTRLPLAPALSGVVGVAVCAWSASRTGDAVDFYLPGLWINTAYALALLISTVPWPRVGPFPAIGLLVGPLTVGPAWRSQPRRLALYQRLTWAFAALFALRLAVQVPLYATGQVAALGVARLVMGVPLLAALAWVAWACLRRLDRVLAAAEPDGTPSAAGPTGGPPSGEPPGGLTPGAPAAAAAPPPTLRR